MPSRTHVWLEWTSHGNRIKNSGRELLFWWISHIWLGNVKYFNFLLWGWMTHPVLSPLERGERHNLSAWETAGIQKSTNTELTWALPALAPENSKGLQKRVCPDKTCPNTQRTCSPGGTSPKKSSDLIRTGLPLPMSIKPFVLIIWGEQGWEHKVCFCIIKMKRFCWGLITLEMQRLLQKHNEYQIYLQKGLLSR